MASKKVLFSLDQFAPPNFLSKSPRISIKLLIHPKRNRVILVEAGNDFVNTLRTLLTFPLGRIARLCCMQPGCLSNLYNSVQNLSLNNFRTDACKHILLYPLSIHDDKHSKNLKLNMEVAQPSTAKYFLCEDWHCKGKPVDLLSYCKNETSRCSCGKLMNREVCFTSDGLKEHETDHGVLCSKVETKFFITDDLRGMKGLPCELLNFLLDLGIDDANQIEEKVVEIGAGGMSNILSHSLVSKTTFTDVFLGTQGIRSSTTSMLDEQFMLVDPSKEGAKKDSKTSVHVMLRKSDKKVLYAEASDDFVDLLFTFLTSPLESVLELLAGKGNHLTVGSISNLFKYLDTLFSITKQNNSQKRVLPPFYSCPIELPSICSMDPPTYYCYSLRNCYYLSYRETGMPLKPLDPKSPNPNTTNSSGYVEKESLFVVTHDLVVRPLSSVSSITLLKEIGILLEDVEQQVASIGEVEALGLLRACLCSSSALSALLNVYV